MKKSLVSALTTALVVGAASTTFAAANPFSDVPADHWAYDAIAQLAAEGVVEGYGDGTYAGDQEITRYEMAQMVAKAMAKGANKAALDKLAAEFAEELNSLGVRVSALEKKVDNVKFFGEVRYTASRTLMDKAATDDPTKIAKKTKNEMELRLKMAATVNKNWAVYSRFDYKSKNNGKTSEDAKLDHVEALYAEGVYGKATIDLGQFYFTDTVTEGMTFDDTATGIQLAYAPTKEVKITAMAGRANSERIMSTSGTADLVGARVEYSGKKLYAGAAYYNFKGEGMKAFNKNNKNKSNIWSVGVGYKFDKNFRLYAAYAQNGKAADSKQKKAYAIQLDYKGMNVAKRGSYGAHIAYRYLGNEVVTSYITYNYAAANMKGIELGFDYALDKNIGLHLGYFDGKQIGNKKNAQILFSRVRFFF